MNTSLKMLNLWVVGILCVVVVTGDGNDVYQIGAGIADITGPAAEIGMMGYAQFKQVSCGIHIRQYCRAFVIADNNSRVCFVNLDAAMGSLVVKLEVIKALKERYGDLYTEKNVVISATHTHSGSGGYLQYVLPIITTKGFVRESFNAMLEGIMLCIDRAHNNTKPGYIYWNRGDLYNASINRSPSAYDGNPEEEKAKYATNVDTEMTLLKFTDIDNNPIGMVNWFPVHCTSMNNTNCLLSSDNKGYASLLFEQHMNKGSLPGKGPFVAAFATANEGDVSPNTKGAKCIDTGLPCDYNHSTCNGRTEKCIAFGPGDDMFQSTQIIGQRQFDKALELFNSANSRIKGPVTYIHQYVDMENVQVTIPGGNGTVKTCKAAMGYAFAAGTTDGPGDFDFKQGTKSPSPFWSLVTTVLKKPSEEMKECQKPKPILFATGEMHFPYAWQPSIAPSQIIKIGPFAILAVPGEFTTMSGRRLRETVKETLDKYSKSDNDTIVVISGLSNTYTHYIATYEEYQIQRYEAASTIYGPHTLDAYRQIFRTLAKSLALNTYLLDGPTPMNLLKQQISLVTGVICDFHPLGKSFGTVVKDVDKSYKVNSTVSVTFVSGNPRNNLLLEGTYLTVEKFDSGTSSWVVIATDSSWETKFHWVKKFGFLCGMSNAEISWDIPPTTKPGKYRIRHFGNYKVMLGDIYSYSGTSSVFQVQS